MVLLITFHLELRFASGGTELKLFKDSTVSGGETSVALNRFYGGRGTGGATQLRRNSTFIACRRGPFGAFSTSGYKVG